MDWIALDWSVLISIVALLVCVASGRVKPMYAFPVLAIIYLVFDIVPTDNFLNAFTNPALATLVLLLMVSLAFERSRLLETLANQLLKGSERKALAKLLITTSTLSAFLNNTAVVATFLSHIAKQKHIAPSRLLMPLSYASILGGITTLIGTSTNLVINSFLISAGLPEFGLFELSKIGIPVAVICLLCLFVFRHLLPQHQHDRETSSENNYFLTAQVTSDSNLIGRSIEQNQLRQLDGLYLIEIERQGELIRPVSPSEMIHEHDVLIFTGEITKVATLQHYPGLRVGDDSASKTLNNNLVEVVISNQSELAGKTLQSVDFRTMFNAAVIGIHRGDKRLPGQLGRIPLKVGDALLLATGEDFKNHRNLDRNFHLLSGAVLPKVNTKTSTAIGMAFILVLTLAALQLMPLFTGLLLLLCGLLATKVLNLSEIRRRFPFEYIAIIGSALIIAKGLTESGAASLLTNAMTQLYQGHSPLIAMIVLYLMTWALTEAVTNTAAAALAFPIALTTAESFGLPPYPFILTITFAASACFILPFGYQTHLMVYSAGRYTPKDFVKIGSLLAIVYAITIITLLYTITIPD
ncbi:Sodium-dependent dicarboxylate transporter SdcS [Marinomonas gallaica]|uniref:Sodium-dependent dicarboxylate transporter SdcS n=1 Tax=Marinomonas gallaica TaxID=1806667 RepID=A0A1C3JV20_9GAMM|nr:SLC13 family permease [Marinomonas gallaica]SBT18939.1 Sodium-dependent dicarboxylate transporter SdcS [Marinomonas gallaica]SBT21894.1 Sodium-dependent dicarboxylate transporter SdcS [Marinomonas gallaica]